MTPTRFDTYLKRSALNGNHLEGYAVVYDQVAQVGPNQYEVIDRHAFDKVFNSGDMDVRAFYDHDHSKLLGRQSAGTLELRSDDVGINFRVELPNTSYANDVRALVERGDLTGASFGFNPAKVQRGQLEDGSPVLRHLEVASFLDVSVVAFPAYTGSSVQLRDIRFIEQESNASLLAKTRGKILLKALKERSG